MLIQRNEVGDIIKCVYKSSNIGLSEYNKSTKDLKITFNYGGVYTYKGVKETDYYRLELSDSQGKTFNSYIKNEYDFEKGDTLDKDDTKKIINESVENLKQQYRDVIIDIFSQIESEYINSGKKFFNEALFNELDVNRKRLKELG